MQPSGFENPVSFLDILPVGSVSAVSFTYLAVAPSEPSDRHACNDCICIGFGCSNDVSNCADLLKCPALVSRLKPVVLEESSGTDQVSKHQKPTSTQKIGVRAAMVDFVSSAFEGISRKLTKA